MAKEIKKQIRPVLIKMALYETQEYEPVQGPSLRTIANILQNQYGTKYTTKKANGKLKITRIA